MCGALMYQLALEGLEFPIPENDSPALFKQMTRLITLVEQRQQDIINTLESVQLSKSDIDFVFKLQSQS